jgi:hypothetical protein
MINSGGVFSIENEGDNEIRQGSLERVLLNNMNPAICSSEQIIWYNEIFKTSYMNLKNLSYHIHDLSLCT